MKPRRVHIGAVAVVILIMAICVAYFAPRSTEAEVLSVAEPAIAREFPESYGSHRPYRAKLRWGVWHIRGTFPPGNFGGPPCAEVRGRDKQLIRVYHEQ